MSAHLAFQPEIARQTLRSQRRSLLTWAVSLAGIIALYAVIWPSVKGNAQWRSLFDTLPKSYRALFTSSGQIDLSTPAGYLNIELLSFMGPALIAIYAIATGTAAIAGDEARGTLELTLSAPVARARVLVERFVAQIAGIGVLMTALAVSLWSFSVLFGMGLGISRIVACAIALGLFGVFAGSTALAVGAATGRPALTRSVAAGLVVTSYLVNALAQLTKSVMPARPISPFYLLFGNEPLANGVRVGTALAVAAASVAMVAIGGLLLARRDLA
jgi:ABC-2 type transport system permease protein